MVADKVGRYEIRAELGHGGMASVYHAYDPQFKRNIAVKVLPRELLHDDKFRARFDREAQTIANLEHPAIVPVYDYGEEGGQPFIVMRLMQGGSLADHLEKGVLTLVKAEDILKRVGPALDKAHAQGVVHRDIKPGNILFDSEGKAYVSDFGIAKLTEATTTFTGNSIIGTPAYMSPEQFEGEKKLDGRTDIYSLGTVLYEMLTGRLPYEADTPLRLAYKHVHDPIPNILEDAQTLPSNIQSVVNVALAKDREDRYATVGQMVADMQLVVKGSEPRVAPPTHVFRDGKTSRSLLAFTTLIALILGLIMFARFFVDYFRSLNEREVIATLALTSPPASLQAVLPATEQALKTETWEQGKIAFLVQQNQSNSIFVQDLETSDKPSLLYDPNDSSRLLGLSWSPEGTSLAFRVLGGGISVISDSASTELTFLRNCQAPSWSPNGQQIICSAGGDEERFEIIDSTTGALVQTISYDGRVFAPAWSPLRDEIVFAVFVGDRTEIFLMSLAGGLSQQLAADANENYAPTWSPDGEWIAFQSTLSSTLSEIWIMDRNGNNMKRLTNTPEGSWSRAPAWSPDGQWIAFVSDQGASLGADFGEIYVVSVDGGEIFPITDTGGAIYDWRVSWVR